MRNSPLSLSSMGSAGAGVYPEEEMLVIWTSTALLSSPGMLTLFPETDASRLSDVMESTMANFASPEYPLASLQAI